MDKCNCLIVDDDIDLSGLLVQYLGAKGITSMSAHSIESALQSFNAVKFDLVVLDINLGKESGYALCEQLRKLTNSPIIFMSCRRSDHDILKALSIGGDDYVIKPFSIEVFAAKVQACLRRHGGNGAVMQWKCFTIDKGAMSVSKNGVKVELSATEFELFDYMVDNAGKVLDKSALLFAVWGRDYYSPETLHVYVRKLREKLEDNPNKPNYIKTVWGIGYRLEA